MPMTPHNTAEPPDRSRDLVDGFEDLPARVPDVSYTPSVDALHRIILAPLPHAVQGTRR